MKLSALYVAAYDAICGKHPYHRPWHFQWLWIRDHHAALRRELSHTRGTVLDAGCGNQEYRAWLPPDSSYIGLDVKPPADIIVEPGCTWPLADASADAVICTQVIEHVAELETFMNELARVLKPGGKLIISVPFAFNQHERRDYRRFTVPGIRALLARDFTNISAVGLGGAGSSSIQMLLNWIELTMSQNRTRLVVKALAMPVWIPLCGACGAVGWLIDKLDKTGAFYGNVFAVAYRSGAGAVARPSSSSSAAAAPRRGRAFDHPMTIGAIFGFAEIR
jgi:SAM-dependent methyltransferase